MKLKTGTYGERGGGLYPAVEHSGLITVIKIKCINKVMFASSKPLKFVM